jgi:hypothetical protein
MARADQCVAPPRFPAKTKFQRSYPQPVHGRRVRGAALLAGAILLSIPGAAPAVSAEYRGTQEQQQACTPDVMRLCSDSVPDVDRIIACMRRNRASLSAPCGAVFNAGIHRQRKG